MRIVLAYFGGGVLQAGLGGSWPMAAFWAVFVGCLLLMIGVVRQARVNLHPAILVVWSLWMTWIGVSTAWRRLDLQLDGQVIASRDIPPTRGPRYATEYTLRAENGREEKYLAGCTDDSLPRSMPVGTYLKKQRWQLFYERNGEKVDDYGLWSPALFVCVAICAFAWSIEIRRREKRDSQCSQVYSRPANRPFVSP